MLDLVVKGGFGDAFEARAGQYITIIDLEGEQAGDFVALNSHDFAEGLSTVHSRRRLSSIYFRIGDVLVSTSDRPMIEVVRDTVGVHDGNVPACDATRYVMDFGVDDHRNCLDNLHEALNRYGVSVWQIPEPFNLFQNGPVGADGRMVLSDPQSRAGDFVTFRALIDLHCALSPCPQDIIPGNGLKPTDMRVIVANELPSPGGAR